MAQRKKQSVPAPSLRLTAFHEAGHFVASYRLRENRHRLYLSVEQVGNTLGRSTEEELEENATKWDCKKEIVILFAGRSAEIRLDPNARLSSRIGASNDNSKAKEIMADWLQLNAPARKALESKLRARSEKLVARNWKAITAVAESLIRHKHLEADEAELIINISDGVDGAAYSLESLRAMRSESKREAKKNRRNTPTKT